MATASSRIFIKNLPPNLKDEDFKKHFSSLAPVTDAKFIAKRRIGYVGYKTPEDASKAIKYYNKSFIRMSKINVELARPVDEVQPRKKARYQYDETPLQQIATGDVETPEATSKPKLQEFLSAMAPSSKSKTWANDVLAAGEPTPVENVPEDEAPSDDEYQTLNKKRKRAEDVEEPDKSPETSSTKKETPIDLARPGIDSSHNEEIDTVGDKDAEVVVVEDASAAAPIPPTTDSDWLRSKTSRLLGLVEEDELDKEDIPQSTWQDYSSDSEVKPKTKSIPKIDQPTMNDAASQTDDEQDGTQAPVPPMYSDTGRLFLRNLSYTTSETDLETEFAKYGLIEEVCSQFISPPPRYDERQIGTADSQLMRTLRIF